MLLDHPRGWLFWSGTGAVLRGSKLETCSWKNRVEFGRTEVSVRLDGIVFCALSFGHGPRGTGFEGISKGMDFHVFWGAVRGGRIGNAILRKN